MKTSVAILCLLPVVSGFSFVHKGSSSIAPASRAFPQKSVARKTSTMLMLEQNVIEGIGIGVAGVAFGIGALIFTEQQGERAKGRGSGLSDGMATRITGGLMEDVEVRSVDDLGSLTSKLEAALRQTGGADDDALTMSEDDKRRIEEEAEDGW